jgi:hypothetical protein
MSMATCSCLIQAQCANGPVEQAQVPSPNHSAACCLANVFDVDTRAGRVVAASLWILLERLRDAVLAGKCEMLDDCFVESS